jgi:hypothetical protein
VPETGRIRAHGDPATHCEDGAGGGANRWPMGIGRYLRSFLGGAVYRSSAVRIDWTEGAMPPLVVLALLAWVLFGAVVYALAG